MLFDGGEKEHLLKTKKRNARVFFERAEHETARRAAHLTRARRWYRSRFVALRSVISEKNLFAETPRVVANDMRSCCLA